MADTGNPSSPAYDELRVNNFDLIRLFAALQVATVHVLSHARPPGLAVAVVDAGLRLFPGVPVFFVISGFLISRSYEQAASVRDYYRNRCLRIYPALWVCLVCSAGLVAFKMHAADQVGTVRSAEWLRWWAAQMTLFQQYAPEFLHGVRLNGSLWTIPVELEFYILIPVLYAVIRFCKRGGDVFLLMVLAVSAVAHRVFVNAADGWAADNRFVLDSIVPYLWMFLTGVLIQRNWSSLRSWLIGKGHWWLPGYILVFGLIRAFIKVGVGSADINLVCLLPLAAVVIACATSARGLSGKILGHNDYSYGTYIYHMLILAVMAQLGAPHTLLMAALAVSLSAAVGALSWFCVEKPFLRQKHDALRSLAALARRPVIQTAVPDRVQSR